LFRFITYPVCFGLTSTGKITINTGRAPYTSARHYILWDFVLSHRGSVKDTSPMCHAPLQHGLRRATHNTLGLGSWSMVPYSLYSETDLPLGQSRDHPDQPRARSLVIRHLPTCLVATQAPRVHLKYSQIFMEVLL
jgi:hypothetical protein